MTPDEERWAEALAVNRRHGDGADAFAAGRIAALAGDPAGQARWREIATRIAELHAAAARPAS